jgi:hypothetical protein
MRSLLAYAAASILPCRAAPTPLPQAGEGDSPAASGVRGVENLLGLDEDLSADASAKAEWPESERRWMSTWRWASPK